MGKDPHLNTPFINLLFAVLLSCLFTSTISISWRDLLHNDQALTFDELLQRDREWMRINFTSARDCAATRSPKLFNAAETPASTWPARRWSEQSVAQPPDAILPNVGWSPNRTHRFSSPDRTLLQDEIEAHTNWKPHATRNVKRKDLFTKCSNQPNQGYYHYLSGRLMPMSFGEIYPYESFIVPPSDDPHQSIEVSSNGGLHPWVDKGLVTVSMFMGCEGSRTQLHYDEAHNFFFQLSGRKRFVLFPPNTIEKFYMIPYGHPEYRQSGLESFEAIDLTAYPAIEGARGNGRVVELNAGETLYVPPYWLHYVESLTHSISIQFFTISSETTVWARQQDTSKIVFDQLLQIPLPFESDWTEMLFGLHSFEYMCLLLENFESSRWWSSELHNTGVNADDRMRFYLNAHWRTVVSSLTTDEHRRDDWNLAAAGGCCTHVVQSMQPFLKTKFQDRSETVYQVLKQAREELWMKVLFMYLDLIINYTFTGKAIRYVETISSSVCPSSAEN